jgi:general secretion pathway protein A
MYAQFFGLKHEPFSIAPDPRYLFMSERHREALAHLLYGVNGGGGFVLLSGEIGAGKTTVCRCFLEQVPRRCNVAYIFNPKLTVVELLKSICDEFHVPYEHSGPQFAQVPPTVKDYVDPLNEFLLRTHAVGQNNLLVIDEAQNLSAEVLEQLRLLTNLETSDRKLLQIILIGQPELRTMLARPELEQLAQRVIARFHLEALSPAESEKYIAHRLSVAGMTGTLPFNREARARIHALSRGIPRRINLLADRSLLGAYASGKTRVDRAIVDKAAVEVFGTLGLPEAGRSAPERRVVVAAAALAGVALAGVIGAAAVGALQRPAPGAALAASAPKTTASASAAASGAATLARAAPAAASATTASTASTASSAPNAPSDLIAVTPATDPAELRGALGAAARNERDAWRELAQSWGANFADGEPCLLAVRQRLQCFRGSGSLASLRQLDRPAILTLRGENDEPLYAVMTGLGPQSAVLQTASARRSVSLLTLAQMWRGEFATLWRAPEGYRASAGEDGGNAASQWVATRLTALQGSPRTPEAEVPLKSRISAFQMTQGLKPDGLAGPMTYMQLNRVSGVDEPKLQAQK